MFLTPAADSRLHFNVEYVINSYGIRISNKELQHNIKHGILIMAQRRPSRKKRIIQSKRTKHYLVKRAIRRRIERLKNNSRENKWEVFYVVGGIFLAMAAIVVLYRILQSHHEAMHHH